MGEFISAVEFAVGTAQLAAAWQRCLPHEPGWRWVPSQQPFATARGGGYLELELSVPAAQPQQTRGAAASALPAAGAAGNAAGDGQRWNGQELEVGEEAEDPAELELDLEEREEQEEDPADARQCRLAGATSAAARLALTCHVAYHLSYRVPVLCFEVTGPGGVPLGSLDGVLALLPRLRAAVASGQPGTVVTQEEHPFLQRPFFMLHPCQTGDVMKLLLDNPGNPAAAATPTAAAAADQRALRYLLAWLSVVGQPLGLGLPAELWLQACTER